MSLVPLGFQYLVGTLIVLAALAVVAALWASQRRMIVVSALLATPHALSALLVVPYYWKPPSILMIGIALEDVLFMMGVGGWAWVYAVLIVHNRIVVSFEAGQMARRYLWMLLACGAVGAAIAQLPGSQRIYAILAFMAVVPVIVVLWRLELWPMAAFGGIFGAVSYTVTMTAGSMIWPDFMGLWRAENLWGPTIAGVPIEELVWGALYGPSWALAMAFVVDARVADGGTDRNLRSRAHSKTPGR